MKNKWLTASNVKAVAIVSVPVLVVASPALVPFVAYLGWALHGSLKGDEDRRAKREGLRARQKFASYNDYLTSPEWQEKRRAVIARAGGCCERAGCPHSIQEVHHLHYPKLPMVWGEEPVTWLLGLCREHHLQAHGKSARGLHRADGSD